MSDEISRVRLHATRHRWQIATDTGALLGWWAFTQRGLIGLLARLL